MVWNLRLFERMYIAILVFAVLVAAWLLLQPRRRRPGEPFDWTRRRRWWRPRWAFPDNR